MPILTDPTDTELAGAVEENLYALFRAMATLPGGDVEEGARLCRHHAFPSNPMFKGVWRTRLDAADVDAAIDDTIAWFRARGAPFLFWWTGAGTTPPDLGERLAARGFLSMEQQAHDLIPGARQTAAGAPAMVADLSRVSADALAAAPPGFAIEEVRDEGALGDFKRVFVATYEVPEWAGQAWVDATMAFGIGRTPWRLFVGRLDGEAVATTILFNGGGVASVYGVATLPGARGRGIGAAITLAPLLDARAEGYRHAALFSTEMGIRVYERIGFRETGARINRYLWRDAG